MTKTFVFKVKVLLSGKGKPISCLDRSSKGSNSFSFSKDSCPSDNSYAAISQNLSLTSLGVSKVESNPSFAKSFSDLDLSNIGLYYSSNLKPSLY